MQKHVYKLGLMLLITFHLLNILNWLYSNQWPEGKDWFMHLPNTYTMIDNLSQEFTFDNLMFVDVSYPPLYYWTAILLSKLFFNNHQYIFLTPFLFLVVLILSIYGIGKQLKNKDVGFLSAIFCSFFYIIYKASIQYNLILAAPAMTALIIYLLLKCEGFKNINYSILLGVSLGLGFLTRQFIILFVAGPILVTIWHSFKKNSNISKYLYRRKLINLIIFIVIACIIMALFSMRLSTIRNVIMRMTFVEGQIGGQSIFSMPHLTYYIRVLPQQIGFLNTSLFIISFCLLLYSNGYKKQILLSWIAVPFFCLTFVYLKFSEYAVSYLPAIALIIASAIDRIKREDYKKGIAVLFVIIGMCFYLKNF